MPITFRSSHVPGKTLLAMQYTQDLPQPSNIHFVSPMAQERLILHALRCGHNVTISVGRSKPDPTFFWRWVEQID